MKMKENLVDVVIILLLCIWGVYELFFTPFAYDSIVTIFIGVSLSCLFPLCCKRTDAKFMRIRYQSLIYSFTYIISIFSALKIVEVLRERVLDATGLKLIFVGVFLQSAYFLIQRQRCEKNK